MTLSDDDIRAIVARAEALQHAGDLAGDEAEALVRAGEELGIARSAMQRALRERIGTRLNPVTGDLVFARSSDDKYYAAEVLSLADDGYRVRFLRGGERVVATDELRECPFLPGDRVSCPWPGWGAWTGTVVSHDAENNMITISDGWAETAVFAARDVWLAPRSAEGQRRKRIYAALLAAGAVAGAGVGALITALIM
jgi:hypothetical protein